MEALFLIPIFFVLSTVPLYASITNGSSTSTVDVKTIVGGSGTTTTYIHTDVNGNSQTYQSSQPGSVHIENNGKTTTITTSPRPTNYPSHKNSSFSITSILQSVTTFVKHLFDSLQQLL